MEDNTQVTPAQPVDALPVETPAPVYVPVYQPAPTPAPVEVPLRIEIDDQPIRTTTVVLTAEDFGPNEQPVVGLRVVCRTDIQMGVRKKLISLVSAGRNRNGTVDVLAQMEVLTTAEGAIVSIVQDWNIDKGGVPMSISIESLDLLPDATFNAVSKAVGKGLSQGSLDPNSAQS